MAREGLVPLNHGVVVVRLPGTGEDAVHRGSALLPPSVLGSRQRGVESESGSRSDRGGLLVW